MKRLEHLKQHGTPGTLETTWNPEAETMNIKIYACQTNNTLPRCAGWNDS